MNIGKIGRNPVPPEQADEAAQRRVAAARRCRAWEEKDPATLLRREGGYIVDSDTDEAFRIYRGDAISAAAVLIADTTPLAFYVDGDQLVFLEPQARPWTQILYERERRAWDANTRR